MGLFVLLSDHLEQHIFVTCQSLFRFLAVSMRSSRTEVKSIAELQTVYIPFVQSLRLVPLRGNVLFYVSLCSWTPVPVNFLSCPGCGEDSVRILLFCEELE